MMLPENNEVHLWIVSLRKTSDEIEKLKLYLDDDESDRAERYYFEKDKNSFTVSRGVLKHILGLYFKKTPGEIKLSFNEFGKPFLTESGLSFNVSHSGDILVLVFTENDEIGIDIEKVRYVEDMVEIAQRNFTHNEFVKFMQSPLNERENSFFDIWTKKEAFIKAIGEGFSCPLEDFEVSQDNSETRVRIYPSNKKAEENWFVFSLNAPENYKIAVSTSKNAIDVTTMKWEHYFIKA